MIVEFPDEEKETRNVPIEDIGIVVLENQQITITQGLLAALVNNNTAVISCDAKHMPEGLMLPMAKHTEFTEKFYAQLESSQPLRKNLWQQTVVAKIRNQAAMLDGLGVEVENMLYWASQVKSGDPDNYEGRAAAYYWAEIFDQFPSFRRHRHGEPPNNLLNYGYAILRGIIARSLVGSGLFTGLGIHHRNKYNQYCLADDIMEPFRPYVDQIVLSIVSKEAEIEELTTAHKAELLSIATVDIKIDDEYSPLLVGAQRTTASLRKCFEGITRKLSYPEL
ncbi:CRISPR-associated endonuclease Cas1 [Salinivirga cyanobacteriivorans]|uniref:CRISPR-associated endonuclease Cas1 n=2 Tax=Salinivirga cyanobacteriivorans TaxID=1307839 RepID=A0A0S2HXH3_9BACT|nr:CRISPR-associated endonuclease Cas1 [Salinivirga cyanobacteriivorans]